MSIEILLPKLGLTMEEGEIIEWCKQEGEQISKGDVLYVLETEKISYEFESPATASLVLYYATLVSLSLLEVSLLIFWSQEKTTKIFGTSLRIMLNRNLVVLNHPLGYPVTRPYPSP